MKTKKNLSIIFLMFLFGSCGDNKTSVSDPNVEVINIDPHTVDEFMNLSEIVDSVKYIKLQIDPKDVMGDVREIVIKEKYIYAIDLSQFFLFVFDKEGKFVAKLDKRGQGPDEYISMGAVFIDDNEEYIEFPDMSSRKMKKYTNITFELIENLSVPRITYDIGKKNSGYYYFITHQNDNTINGKETNAELIILDEKNNLKTHFEKKINTNHTYFMVSTENFTKNDKNELFLSPMYSNTFYKLEGEEVIPVITIDFGKYGMDNNSIGLLSNTEQMDYIRKMNNLASFPVLNINNSDIMSFSYFFKKEGGRWNRLSDIYQYIKFKKSNKIYHVNKIKNDITDFPKNISIDPLSCAHEHLYDDYLVEIVKPGNYFSDEELGERIFVEGLGEITAEDDPIIVLMKLKKR